MITEYNNEFYFRLTTKHKRLSQKRVSVRELNKTSYTYSNRYSITIKKIIESS